jgi:protein KTI12
LKGDKNTVFADSRQEKEVRGRLKSEVIRLLNKEALLICDGLNYIKGEQTARIILV